MHDSRDSLRIGRRFVRGLLTSLLLLALIACGGGNGTDENPLPTTYPPLGGGGGGSGGGGGTGSGGGGSGGGGVPAELAGGVLATFQVGNEQFSLWTDVSVTGQMLVDAFAGAIAPITSVCADVQPGPGQGGHNAPWNWSVRTTLTVSFGTICFGCAAAWSTPTLAEAGFLAGPPYNCRVGQGTRAMIWMQVVLTDVQDYR